jgi:hypothetical protein
MQMRTSKERKENAGTCVTPDMQMRDAGSRFVLSHIDGNYLARPGSFQVFDSVRIADYHMKDAR